MADGETHRRQTHGAKYPKKRNSHQCDECHMSFSRPSHLARHALSHRSRNDRSSAFSCTECGKKFLRKDILLRHLRSVHRKIITRNGSAQRSCLHCVAKKLKCDRAQPCQSCVNTRSTCLYKDGASEHQRTTSFSAANTPGTESVQDDSFQQLYSEDSSDSSRVNQSLLWNETTLGMTGLPQSNSDASPMDQSTDTTFLPDGAGPNLDPYSVPPSIADRLVSPVPYMGGNLTDILSSGISFGYGGLDWLDIQLQDHLLPINTATNINSKDSIMTPPTDISDPSGHESQIFSSSNWNNSTQPQNILASPANPRPSSDQHAIQQWPFDGTREQVHPRYRLSPLREVLQESLNSTTLSLSHSLMKGLVDLLSNKYVPKLDESTDDYESLRAMRLLQRSVDLFVSQFHSVLPTIHIPTLKIYSCPTVLLASMACIGAMFLEDKDALEKSEAFSRICATVILWLGGSDANSYCDLDYLTACCLYQIYSLGSGNRQLYQDADRSRGVLIGGLRGMGLFKSQVPCELDGHASQLQTPIGTAETQASWLQWKSQEQEKRLAWSVFEYDCSLCTLTNRRGMVDLGELPSRLPCPEALWEAPSAQAWRTLSSRSPTVSCGLPLMSVIRAITSGKKTPAGVSSWGRRLCGQVIGRLLWDLKQMEGVSILRCLGLPPLFSIEHQTKTKLLQIFDNLARETHSPESTKELIDYNITQLIIHYSFLNSAESVMELVVFLVRVSATKASGSGEENLDAAKQQLRKNFALDPCLTRKLVWHAAQIIGVANEYLVSAPCEILRVFMGCIFLVAFAKYSPTASETVSTNTVELDRISQEPKQIELLDSWIRHGGTATIVGAEITHSSEFVSHITNHTQTLMRKVQFWGLSQKFSQILQMFQDIDS